MTITDTRGNVHKGNGIPGAGEFTAKSNSRQTAILEQSTPADLTGRRGASLTRGEFGGYTMIAVHTMPGEEGEAFQATLAIDGAIVGTVHQDGRGGATYCQFRSADARDAFDQMVKTNWNFEREFNVDGAAFTDEHTDETVLDALYFETLFSAQLADARRRGKLPVLTRSDIAAVTSYDGIHMFSSIPRRADDVAAAARDLQATGDLEGARYWDGTDWVPFEEGLSGSRSAGA